MTDLSLPSRQSLVARQLPLAAATRPDEPLETLIDLFLAEQNSTSAVERFAQRHEDATEHLQARWYADLMPVAAPAPGQQYAFEVDLDACTGCKSCVTACNNLNGLEPSEQWREVGVLVGVSGGVDTAVQQSVTSACHHCVDPGCLSGCPANAYEKDPVTGVVRHLDDACIGCQYCTLTCPYEVPAYNADLGIVRKCDLCHDRLADGEAPACVQSCPTRAISIRVVDVEEFAAGQDFGFSSPTARTTAPTTRFRSRRDLTTGVEPIDLRALRPGHAHLPLTIMLVVTQAAVGGFATLALLGAIGLVPAGVEDNGAVASAVLAIAAILVSVAHLGRPLLAWRAVLGFGHSWLSREIVAFGAFAATGVWAAAERLGVVATGLGAVTEIATVTGLVGVLTSAMVYVATGRTLWRWPRVVPRFLATVVATGGAVTATVVAVTVAVEGADTGGAVEAMRVACAAAAAGAVAGAVMDLVLVSHRRRGVGDPLGRAGLLLAGSLRGALQSRFALGAVGALFLLVSLVSLTEGDVVPASVFAVGALLALVGAELVERWWFFTAEADLRMPGGRR